MKGWFNRFSAQILATLPPQRLLSLDVFRGVTITAMVLVNNPGSWSYTYAPMAHAKWHGWTPTDLIFPFFVFIIGISMAIVMDRKPKTPEINTKLIKTAFVRGAKLFALGLFLAVFYYDFTNPKFDWLEQQVMSIRIMGVLQRLGLIFFATVCIVLWFKQVGRALIMATLLLGYWAILMWVPYGNEHTGLFVGKLEFGNNISAWLDDTLFASKNLYFSSATPFAFDPEGVLSTFPAIAGALAGVFTGELLLKKHIPLIKKVKLMLIAGGVCLFVAKIWSIYLPINKSIWTSSYVVMSTGWGLVCLGVLTYIVDIKKFKYWTAPFVIFGANAIAFYMFSAIVARLLIMIPVADTTLHGWLFQKLFQPLFGNYLGSLMFAIAFCLGSFLVMKWLYQKKIFFKV
ncbi:DUF5009 domain-containing protein [Psychrosphaera sp. B3R10]|uniref:acyltransferase family protein n=1 Tax=unclassified Psychrosphaera TaxID=2641570 RepID=UPI001C090475|nr:MULTISPECIES: DUF5009 domain-containing protein [unclassified Psychrosphaera]MBU2880440.1 DUF5009 domain-containing protein [Psychrosphaera sp. I2R16]MBU2991459.1 DUF5009 domain-containing protein [Psychrosphaera sp. B3R10]